MVILQIGAVLILIREKHKYDEGDSICINVSEHQGGCIVESDNVLDYNTLWMKILADCSRWDTIVDTNVSKGTS